MYILQVRMELSRDGTLEVQDKHLKLLIVDIRVQLMILYFWIINSWQVQDQIKQ